jgi:hypothetical protein
VTCLDIKGSFLSFHVIHELLLYDMIKIVLWSNPVAS